MIRVLIVDDSALLRQLLKQILSEDPEIEVVGMASDPLVAREKIKALNPDVITLDVEMPRLDGLAFLDRIMRLRPMPVVMVSALTQQGAEATLQALELGAVDFVGKPTLDVEAGWEAMKKQLVTTVKAAARASVQPKKDRRSTIVKPPSRSLGVRGSNSIVAIGASTGGVMALTELLSSLPADGPPILVAQHMPPGFTHRFADRLNGICAMAVSEARQDARVIPGHVYIAPGDQHLTLTRSGGQYHCHLDKRGLVNGHMPSVDVLFDSVAAAAGMNAIGVLLTGMGKDGAVGMKNMRHADAVTVCQDEASSLIYGMPKAAIRLGAVQTELPLSKIAPYVLDQSRGVQPQ